MEEDSGIGAELTRLADLYERGALSDREFEKHKRQLLNGVPWWRKKPLAGVGIAGAVVSAIALTVGLSATPSGKPASKSLNKVEIATVSATSSQLQEAISYANKYVGDNHDAGLCLEFMQEAYRAAGISLWENRPPQRIGRPIRTGSPGCRLRPTEPRQLGPFSFGALVRGTPPATWHSRWAMGRRYPLRHFPTTAAFIRVRVFIMTLSQRSSSAYNYVGYLIPGVVSPPSLPTPVAPPRPRPSHPSKPPLRGRVVRRAVPQPHNRLPAGRQCSLRRGAPASNR